LQLGGSIELVRRSSLYVLGHLYSKVSHNYQQQIVDILTKTSHDERPLIRRGTAMALRQIESQSLLPLQLVLILVKLLHDEDDDVRSWTGDAIGHLIAQGSIHELITEHLVKHLARLAGTEKKALARDGLAYGIRKLVESKKLDTDLHEYLLQVLGQLVNDVNFRVRQAAKLRK
jgi:HEAT repeat protein